LCFECNSRYYTVQYMKRRGAKLSLVVGGLLLLYSLGALLLWSMLAPGGQFEYMVVGAGATGIAMVGFYAGCVLKWRCEPGRVKPRGTRPPLLFPNRIFRG